MIRREDLSPDAWAAVCMPLHEIIPATEHTGALFAGSWFAGVDPEVLDANDIKHIVAVHDGSLMGELPSQGRGVYAVLIEDSPRVALRPHLAGACNYIADKLGRGENVLVHCQQGISRSAAIVIAYLIWSKGMDYDDAFGLVKSRRRCVKPNSGFEKTLREWGGEINQKTCS
ncbi:hypothetical protein M0805_006942 [Coniferiporia weirii]|nr:hypothetical protein M0805_006942 [Coniferiporia weirii]